MEAPLEYIFGHALSAVTNPAPAHAQEPDAETKLENIKKISNALWLEFEATMNSAVHHAMKITTSAVASKSENDEDARGDGDSPNVGNRWPWIFAAIFLAAYLGSSLLSLSADSLPSADEEPIALRIPPELDRPEKGKQDEGEELLLHAPRPVMDDRQTQEIVEIERSLLQEPLRFLAQDLKQAFWNATQVVDDGVVEERIEKTPVHKPLQPKVKREGEDLQSRAPTNVLPVIDDNKAEKRIQKTLFQEPFRAITKDEEEDFHQTGAYAIPVIVELDKIAEKAFLQEPLPVHVRETTLLQDPARVPLLLASPTIPTPKSTTLPQSPVISTRIPDSIAVDLDDATSGTSLSSPTLANISSPKTIFPSPSLAMTARRLLELGVGQMASEVELRVLNTWAESVTPRLGGEVRWPAGVPECLQ